MMKIREKIIGTIGATWLALFFIEGLMLTLIGMHLTKSWYTREHFEIIGGLFIMSVIVLIFCVLTDDK